jgi:hypothetical protein
LSLVHDRPRLTRLPLNLGGLISVRLADVVGSMGQVQVLRIVGVADDRLAGQDVLEAPGAPAGLFEDFACRRGGRAFAVVDVAAGKFPDPAVNDEPVAPHEQDALAAVIEDRGHGAAAHPEDVLGELRSVGQLDVCMADADVRGVVHHAFTVDCPPRRVSHVLDSNGGRPGSRRYAFLAAGSIVRHAHGCPLYSPQAPRSSGSGVRWP